ncbi:GFA family protein [Denitromonas halophila]|uniref:CENP-V/GFA domain-containing protein n=1 Tax=Denitromonas halophila TaxID=1629404 RepID=A0A557QXE4_9RHOO|nr:hypothetical protein [Denitromonas halophila]TVO57585.1 hypothetical protein FHP91_07885 [Denitromonas halophila]
MLIQGSCHCANISFQLDWSPSPSDIPARVCDCSFCVKHGGVWTAHPQGTLTVSVKNDARVSRYTFGTRTARFHVCQQCGVVPVVTSRIEGRELAVVNVNTFNNVPAAMLRLAPVSFDGEDTSDRLARRARNWIGDVRFVTGDV